MSKELGALECLEALEQDIKDRVILVEDRQLKLCAVIKQALLELKSIKEANPSEALKCLEDLYCEPVDYRSNDRAKDYEYVKQALLKAEKYEKIILGIEDYINLRIKVAPLGDVKKAFIEIRHQLQVIKEVLE